MFTIIFILAGIAMIILGRLPDIPLAANHRNPQIEGIWVRIAGGLLILANILPLPSLLFVVFMIAVLVSIIIAMVT